MNTKNAYLFMNTMNSFPKTTGSILVHMFAVTIIILNTSFPQKILRLPMSSHWLMTHSGILSKYLSLKNFFTSSLILLHDISSPFLSL